jgi:ATP-binding cassette, subfamily B, bacterial PglK
MKVTKFFAILNEFLFILGKSKRKIPLLVVLFILASLLDLIGIGIIAPYIGLLVNPELLNEGKIFEIIKMFGLTVTRVDLITYLSIFIIAIFCIKFIMAMSINWIILRFCYNQSTRLRAKLMQVYQYLPYTDFVKRNSSEYIYNINNLVPLFALSILQSVLRLMSEGIVTIFIFFLLFWYDPITLTFFIAILATIIFSYDRLLRKKIYEYGLIVNDSSTKMVQNINEGVNGLKELRVLGKENFFLNRVVSQAKIYSDVSLKTSMITTAPRYFLEFLIILLIALIVIFSKTFEINSENLVLTLSIFGMASIRLMPSFTQIINSLTQIRFGRNTIRRVYSDLQQKTVQSDSVENVSKNNYELFETLDIQNVSFSYSNSEALILDNISLKIKNKDSIGIIGASGSGKTTLVDLLLGLLTPESGIIRFNNKLISGNFENLRNQTAYLPQETFLIDDTIRNNIALGIQSQFIDDRKVMESIERARLSPMLESLPNGLDSFIGEEGSMISGGQKQRIALARAFYHNRKILVMDESTSALDNETENEIVNEIKNLKEKITLIVITHKSSTIQHLDHVFKLNMGQLVRE